MLKMSRKAQVLRGLGWTLIGWAWLEVVGTVCLDARGGPNPVEDTVRSILFCSPGILFLSVGMILLIRAARNIQ